MVYMLHTQYSTYSYCSFLVNIVQESLLVNYAELVANYSYEAQDDDELSLEAGQIVEILVEHENGWWLGRVNGVEGFIPSNYVKKLDIEG